MSLLTAATAAASRSASSIVAKVARGFQVLRIDGYSLTKTMLPSGESIHDSFVVGGRHWNIHCYPNGGDRSSSSSDYLSLYLRLDALDRYYGHNNRLVEVERVRAQFKFSLLDAAGNPAYEQPAQTSVFACCSGDREKDLKLQGLGCGHDQFISADELERRRDSLLKDDCLAIRCDVAFMATERQNLGSKYYNTAAGHYSSDSDYDSDDDDGEKPRRRRKNRRRLMDDKEFIRRCLAEQRRRK